MQASTYRFCTYYSVHTEQQPIDLQNRLRSALPSTQRTQLWYTTLTELSYTLDCTDSPLCLSGMQCARYCHEYALVTLLEKWRNKIRSSKYVVMPNKIRTVTLEWSNYKYILPFHNFKELNPVFTFMPHGAFPLRRC
jgi:hypothetical protein